MSAFTNVMNTVPKEYKKFLNDGIMVIPINTFFLQYPNMKESMCNHIFSNMKSSDIIEPLAVKLQIVSAAAEAACMILRIDDVISVSGAR